MTTPHDSTLVTAQKLTTALNEMAGRLEEAKQASEERDAELAKYGRFNRILVIVAIVGFLLDVTATTVAFVAYARVGTTITRVERNAATIAEIHQANVAACENGNARAARQEQALDAILAPEAPRNGETKAQEQAVKALLARDRFLVHQGWGARNCRQIYKLVGRQ